MICLAIVFVYHIDAVNCETHMVLWLTIFSFIGLSEGGIKLLAYGYLEHTRYPMKVIKAVNILELLVIEPFRVGWLIYGNTFHFSKEQEQCKNLNSGSYEIWRFMEINIIIGYLTMLIYCCACCSVIALLRSPRGTMSEFLAGRASHIPKIKLITNLTTKKY